MSALGQLRVWIAEALDPVHARVDALEARVAALEDRLGPASATAAADDRGARLAGAIKQASAKKAAAAQPRPAKAKQPEAPDADGTTAPGA